MAGETVAIIPCTNQKSDTRGPAREVWVGGHFQLILAHTEMFYDKILVMSYKYGLISPDFEIDPYDVDMRTSKAGDRLRWWFMMKGHIKTLAETEPLLVALYTGMYERERIMREFVTNKVPQIILPFEGLKVGDRMSKVYDCEPPFDKKVALEGGYALAENWNKPSGGKYLPPPTNITTDIEWE